MLQTWQPGLFPTLACGTEQEELVSDQGMVLPSSSAPCPALGSMVPPLLG